MRAALIVIDMLNPYEHDDVAALMRSVAEVVQPLCELIAGARRQDMLTVYVNDNHDDFTAGPQQLAQRALSGNAPELVGPILPPEGTPFVAKARHSIFYQTLLEYLLRREEIDCLVLAGQVTEQCILYSALDGYVRHFDVAVARDCVAHIHEDLAMAAVRMMQTNMRASVTATAAEALELAAAR